MKVKLNIRTLMSLLVAATMVLAVSSVAIAAEKEKAKHNIVIQVSSADAEGQAIALNNAVNVQKALGMDNVNVEVVAYGPGLGLLTPSNKQAIRVKSLATQGIVFSACGNTMEKIEKKTGKKVALTEGVRVVPGGVIRIMNLQEDGWTYIRP